MARRMADEILETERKAQQRIADAVQQAADCQDEARRRAGTKAGQILAHAQETAKAIIDRAVEEAEQERQQALAQAREHRKELEQQAQENQANAVKAVMDLLASEPS
ncbi:MAG: hypothetical protein IJT66_06330 [Clostridia bacterium]|nr:hypothetical protein [Clostridia bacterium]